MVLVADPVIGVTQQFDRDLSIPMGQRDQFATNMLFRRRTFVGVDMRVVTAQNCVIRTVQRHQTEDVCPSSVKGEEHLDPRTKMFLKLRDGRSCIRVVAVSDHVSLIDACKRLENLWMNPGVVVAGKTPSGLERAFRHTKSR